MSLLDFMKQVEQDIQNMTVEFQSYQLGPEHARSQAVANIIKKKSASLCESDRKRVYDEFNGPGPLTELLNNASITEILVNGFEEIWYEKDGQLFKHNDYFISQLSYRNFCFRLMDEAKIQLTCEQPIAQGHLKNFRLQLVGSELSGTQTHISFRRHPDNPWTFNQLLEKGWGSPQEIEILKKIVTEQKNFLVVGGTGTGKTSVLNACLQSLARNERSLLIEDTLELKIPNAVSMRLLTRIDANGILRSIQQAELLRSALRLRPDRLVMGEIRGDEAKDFLMALSTGHQGSFGTLHASSASQALIRLEMLIQIGAPNWSLSAIRRLIQMSLDYILVLARDKSGQRFLEGVYKISSLEENGILLEKTCGN